MMSTTISQEQCLVALTRISRVAGKLGDPYETIFVNQHGSPVVSLTEWYRLRKQLGPGSTCNTYLTCLLPYISFLEEQACPWNASPQQLRPVIMAFYRDRLGCQIHPGKDGESVEIVPTRDTPLRPSTLRVLRAALRDFYLVLKDAGLYAFAHPLTSEVLVALKREQMSTLANGGAPDHAGIREETHERSRRRSTAFLRHAQTQEWKPELRKELADVREGIHAVLNALIDSGEVSLREKAVLELLQNTGARLHEIILMTVGGYRNQGLAGQARVVNKGSYGCEIKTLYFSHNPRVEQALTAYIEQVRPLHDPRRRKKLAEVDDHEALFLTERGTPYSVKSFYYHWYRHYEPLRNMCPVRFSPHDLRHLFVSEFLIRRKLACGAGTDHFDAERYLREREAFGNQVMGWRSAKTLDIYDQTRNGESVLSTLAGYQHDLAARRYVPELATVTHRQPERPKGSPLEEEKPSTCESESVVWTHDSETLAWIKKRQFHAQEEEKGGQL